MPHHTPRVLSLEAEPLLWSSSVPSMNPGVQNCSAMESGAVSISTSACQKKRGATHSDLLIACLRETLWEEGLANQCS